MSYYWLLALQFVFVLLLQAPHAEAADVTTANCRCFCDLSANDIVTLEWDASQEQYVLQQEDSAAATAAGDDNNNNNNNNSVGDLTRRLFGSSWRTITMMGSSSSGDGYDVGDDDQIISQQQPHYLRSSMPEFMYYEPAVWSSSTQQQQQQRQLASSEPQPQRPAVYVDNAASNHSISISKNIDEEQATTMSRTVEARACDCWNDMIWGGSFYCTLPRTHCAIPSSPQGLPGCVDVQTGRRVVRSIWPVLVVWYASVIFCLSFTITGRHAMSCCIAAMYPGWNRRTADRLLERDPNQANQILLRHYRIMRARYERVQGRRRRARRERRGERRGETADNNNTTNTNNNESQRSQTDEPFPSLWDLSIIPRQTINFTSEPVPTTLRLKTRIYRRGDTIHDGDKTDLDEDTDEASLEITPLDEEDASATSNTGGSAVAGEIQPSPAAETQLNTEIPPADDSSNNIVEEDEDMDDPLETSMVDTPADEVNNDMAANMPDIHDHAADMDISEWDECTICYASLEDGDRVGALPCGHMFHVDPCLKHWLARRNVCPLCLSEDIATPQFDRPAVVVSAPGIIEHDAGSSSSSSDVDRSSSQDDDDNSSGILEANNPNIMIPAFGNSISYAAGTSRIRGLASFFRRRNRTTEPIGNVELTTTVATAVADQGPSSQHGP